MRHRPHRLVAVFCAVVGCYSLAGVGQATEITFQEGTPYSEYLLEFRDNKHPDRVYSINIKPSDFEQV